MCTYPDRPPRRRVLLSVLGLALLLGWTPPASADEFHYRDILVGDRAAGMGGAYTAVSDDTAGLYYNPAGTAYAEDGSLSGSMSAFHTTRTRYDDVLGGKGWNRTSQTLVPNFFGVVHPAGRWRLGFSYAVPDAAQEDQDQTFHDLPSALPGVRIDRYVINFNQTDTTYEVGPSLAVRAHDRLSLGLTLYVHYRKRETILNQLINLDNDQYEWSNSYFETTEWGVRPLLGVMWAASERVAVGLAMSRTYVLAADTESEVTFKGIDFPSDRVDRATAEAHDRRRYPLTTTVGVAYFPTPSLLLSGDFSYHEAVHDAFGDREGTWNLALGLEYYLTSHWAVRTGFFTDRANTPEVEEGRQDQSPHVDLYGGSLSLSHLTRSSSVTLGASYSTGRGEDQVVGGSPAVQDVEISSLSVFLSASYRY